MPESTPQPTQTPSESVPWLPQESSSVPDVVSSADPVPSSTYSYTAPSPSHIEAPSSEVPSSTYSQPIWSPAESSYVATESYVQPSSSASFAGYNGSLPSPTPSASDSVETASLIGEVSSAPNRSGSQVVTFTDSSTSASDWESQSASEWQSSATSNWASSSSSASFDDAYTPSQTWLIVASTPVASSAPTSSFVPTTTVPQESGQSGQAPSPTLPTTASIPSSIPTLIVPANSVINQANAGSGSNDDPVKDDTLIALLLSENEYPWLFVVKSSDATSQLFNTFPSLIAGALNITQDEVKTYGLMVYQPATWDGQEASLLTQWLAYIPADHFETLNAYLKTTGSPLFNQPGIQGQLAAQINTAYPLAASTGDNTRTDAPDGGDGDNNKKRDIIIGVCVGVGGLLWIALVVWIYKRVKRSNDKAVHKRLSEHMSMFDGAGPATYGAADNRRNSYTPSIAGSDVDDRPSSFYASPLENDSAMRRSQRERMSENVDSIRTGASLGHSGQGYESPTTYGPSVFGGSWFANPPQQGGPSRQRAQNPFEDMATQSYLNTSGSNGNLQHIAAQRRSQAVQKGMISQPTLQAHSLEFKEY